jgi:hypothetical protein
VKVLSEEQLKRQSQGQAAIMQERRDLGERLLKYGARIIKLVESLPNT